MVNVDRHVAHSARQSHVHTFRMSKQYDWDVCPCDSCHKWLAECATHLDSGGFNDGLLFAVLRADACGGRANRADEEYQGEENACRRE